MKKKLKQAAVTSGVSALIVALGGLMPSSLAGPSVVNQQMVGPATDIDPQLVPVRPFH